MKHAYNKLGRERRQESHYARHAFPINLINILLQS